ncbi:acyl-CoA dehydrogenase family protein [Rhizobium paknamense]|uniref:Alkylation response protein AidB-like acyl-CoA dehydrogenase n=1 Tax=Rhizobium paknamense TaxID=1206817 RepID=A0ABU0IFI6_9HYPH|nr:acyl-CoA dehydrogenase family protein [Rhizobium paknamense]MDQ0456413.1 alkylation response protein AidB-like acyl-CoA dehydrogenase [Rhizobium paknamense]
MLFPEVKKKGSDEVLQTLRQLERAMGDPWDDKAPASFARIMADDEAERFPVTAYDALVGEKVSRWLVPEGCGGMMFSYAESLQMYRAIARRDMTLATVAILPFIGYLSIVTCGTEEQIRRYGKFVAAGGSISWGLSEGQHGSDVLTNETRADLQGDVYKVNGEKWPIGFADRAGAMIVHARTAEGSSPVTHSMLIVDRTHLDRSQYRVLPNERLYGVRGLPLGGVRYEDAPVPASQLLGREGAGLEVTLKSQQSLRLGVAALCLGGLDTGLRLTYGFAVNRPLYGGQKVSQIPVSARQLADAYADLMISEILVASSTRLVHVLPKQMFLYSCISKYLVPNRLDAALRSLSQVLGARFYMRDRFGHGVFQKILRDIGMTSFVDGNSYVNMRIVGTQMGLALGKALKAYEAPEDAKRRELLDEIYDVQRPVGPPRWHQLGLSASGEDLALFDLVHALERLKPSISAQEYALGRKIVSEVERLEEDLKADQARLGRDFANSANFYALTDRYCSLNAAAACVQFALANLDHLPESLPLSSGWLGYVLKRILHWNAPVDYIPEQEETTRLLSVVDELYRQNKAFSVFPVEYEGTVETMEQAGVFMTSKASIYDLNAERPLP